MAQGCYRGEDWEEAEEERGSNLLYSLTALLSFRSLLSVCVYQYISCTAMIITLVASNIEMVSSKACNRCRLKHLEAVFPIYKRGPGRG